jgi:WD40 repeat protein
MKVYRNVLKMSSNENAQLIAVAVGLFDVEKEVGRGYIFDKKGHLLNELKAHSWVTSVDAYNDIIAFVANNNVYLFKGTTFWKKVEIESKYGYAIKLTKDGFIACWSGCAYYDYNGNKKWDLDVVFTMYNPAIKGKYVYIPDNGEDEVLIVELNDGSLEGKVKVDDEEGLFGISANRNYLAVATWDYLYLYDVSDPVEPKRMWKSGKYDGLLDVAISPDGRYVAATEEYGGRVMVYDMNGNKVSEMSGKTSMPRRLTWVGNELYVALTYPNDESAYILKLWP